MITVNAANEISGYLSMDAGRRDIERIVAVAPPHLDRMVRGRKACFCHPDHRDLFLQSLVTA